MLFERNKTECDDYIYNWYSHGMICAQNNEEWCLYCLWLLKGCHINKTTRWDFKKIKKRVSSFFNPLPQQWTPQRNFRGEKVFCLKHEETVGERKISLFDIRYLCFFVLMCLFIIIISVSFWPKKGNADHAFFERCERIDETPSHFFVVPFHWTALLWVVESMKMIDECLILWFTQQNNEPLNDFTTHSVVFQRLMNAIWNDVHQFGGMTNEDFNVACCCTILYFVLFIIAVVSISFYSLYFIFHDDLICFCGRHYLSWWW